MSDQDGTGRERARPKLHLVARPDSPLGCELPAVTLEAWPGISVDIARQWRDAAVVMTTLPDDSESSALADRTVARIETWCGLSGELARYGYDLAFLTSRSLAERHRSLGDHLQLSHTLLSDVDLELAKTLWLPTIRTTRGRDYREITLLANHGHVFSAVAASEDPLVDIRVMMRSIRSARD
jgi:hypothetical protein